MIIFLKKDLRILQQKNLRKTSGIPRDQGGGWARDA